MIFSPPVIQSFCLALVDSAAKYAAPQPRGALRKVVDWLHRQYYGTTGRLVGQSKLSPQEIEALKNRLKIGLGYATSQLHAAPPGSAAARRAIKLIQAESANIMNLPGLLRGLATRPAWTIRTTWGTLQPLEKALTVGAAGLPLAERLAGISPKDRSLPAELAGSAAFIATSGLPLIPSAASIYLTGKLTGSLAEHLQKVIKPGYAATSDRI